MIETKAEVARISTEYERRSRELPAGYYLWNKPGNLFIQEQTVRTCIRLLDRAGMFPLGGLRIADIGCGFGGWLLEFMQWGADPEGLAGIDLSLARARTAQERIPQADVRIGTASELPWADESFDLVSQFTVFTSILDADFRRAVAREMLRVLRPGGAILWFDFRMNNPQNRQVRGIPAPEIRSLFEGCTVDLVPAVLAPPLSRAMAGWARPVAELLYCVPALRTHIAALIRKG